MSIRHMGICDLGDGRRRRGRLSRRRWPAAREVERQMSLRNDGAIKVTCSFGVCDATERLGHVYRSGRGGLSRHSRAGNNSVYISDESCGIPIAA